MKVAAVLFAVEAIVVAASPQQQVFHFPKQFPEAAKNAWSQQLHNLEDVLGSLTDEAKDIWDDIARMYPDDMANASFLSMPKAHARKPDRAWDHIVRGSDVQSIWLENEHGESERELSGKLDTYDLRVKKVDPSSLEVDPGITQYSGYLDDNDNDKHLFYCKKTHCHLRISYSHSTSPLQGFSSPGTTLRMTLLYSG
jgi:cathepsin A (carboxypeptidase C)